MDALMSDRYILRGKEAIPCDDLMQWAMNFESTDRHVAKTTITPADSSLPSSHVSTVFLGLDHAWDSGPPLLFETMVFNGPMDQEMDRYSTWEEAEAGHDDMVQRVMKAYGQQTALTAQSV